MKDSFDKIYLETISNLDENMINEGKLTNSLLAGVASLGIVGGSIYGLNKASENSVKNLLDKYPKTQQVQTTQTPQSSQDTSPSTYQDSDNSTVSQSSSEEHADDFADLTKEELFVARVLYSETSYKASYQEILMVCQVIINRINNREFGNGQNAFEVVKHRKAFSCINDEKNSNWNQFKPNLNSRTKLCCRLARELMKDDVKSNPLFQNADIVYYHDNSIKTPSKWTNRFWRPVKVYTTKNFQFYKITSNVKRKAR
jgi:hypothetical protein